MRHYLRLYRVLIAQQIKCLVEYRGDFIIGLASFFVTQFANILFINIIFNEIPVLDGWGYEEILFIYGFSLIPKGLDNLLTNNLWNFAGSFIKEGELDKYLTKPISPLLYIIMEEVQFDAIGELFLGGFLTTYSYSKLGLSFEPIQIILLIIAFIFSLMIFTGIKIAIASLAFWFKESSSILHLVYMASDFVTYPVSIYTKAIRLLITYIIPFAFTSYFPCEYLLRGGNPVFNIGGTVIAGSVILAVSLLIWRKGLGAYESAGS